MSLIVDGRAIEDDGHTLVLRHIVVIAISGSDLDNTQTMDVNMAVTDVQAAIRFGLQSYLPAATELQVLAVEIRP